MVSIVGSLHKKLVLGRRARVLAGFLSPLLWANDTVLDVGCGDGTIDSLLEADRPDIAIKGIDILIRSSARFQVTAFDGVTIPFADRSYDIVMFVDVLHHARDPTALLKEAARVARRAIVIKDHTLNGAFAAQILRFMDWVGNAGLEGSRGGDYWPEQKWRRTFDALGLKVDHWRGSVPLYQWPFSMIFGRDLHFIARLVVPIMEQRHTKVASAPT
jgi:SAM-dependent methyltransferase